MDRRPHRTAVQQLSPEPSPRLVRQCRQPFVDDAFQRVGENMSPAPSGGFAVFAVDVTTERRDFFGR
ncbi:MAG TPA: hypothetical protein VEZ72_13445 [Paenibacillus sp.]|nr:hypothetical protein [Paenibacillus sp.]